MRIESRIVDGDIEKKSLHEKNQQPNGTTPVESYDALFMNYEQILGQETLSKLEVVDDEDWKAAFDAREIGKSFVPNMDTQEVENASNQELAESMDKAMKDMIEIFGLDPAEIEKMQSELEDKLRDVF